MIYENELHPMLEMAFNLPLPIILSEVRWCLESLIQEGTEENIIE